MYGVLWSVAPRDDSPAVYSTTLMRVFDPACARRNANDDLMIPILSKVDGEPDGGTDRMSIKSSDGHSRSCALEMEAGEIGVPGKREEMDADSGEKVLLYDDAG